MPARDALDQAARTYLERAFGVLRDEHVLPVPRYRRHLRVGTDYFGFLDSDAHDVLEAEIIKLHPRFSSTTKLSERDFANPYISSFLESCIAELARTGDGSLRGRDAASTVDKLINELRLRTATPDADVAFLRLITHLDTHDRRELELGSVTVHPITREAAGWRRETADVFEQTIFGAGYLVDSRAPIPHAPPSAVMSTRLSGARALDEIDRTPGTIERALLAIRLLYAATCESAYEVKGETGRIRFGSPSLTLFRGNLPGLFSPTTMLRRVATLAPTDSQRIQGVIGLLDPTRGAQDGMIFTSIGMAFQKFTLSFHAHTWWEQIVDLATALEAAISGTATTDVTLRLKTRSAALLSTDKDPAPAIFNDIDVLYSLRSTLVHGGNLSSSALEKRLRRLTTVPDDTMFGTAAAYAVDRLRDLVRRALLARIALAGGATPLWPLGSDRGIDANLADPAARDRWRGVWRDAYAAIDAAPATDQPSAAVEAMTPHRPSAADPQGSG